MAKSRLEKIGTIYTRTRGLIEAGALHWEDRPIWYDIYEAFPPKEEPRFDRPIPNVPLRKIFYDEDKIRALLHNRNKQIGTINMFNHTSQTLTKRFIDAYKKLEQHQGDVSQEQLYEEVIELLQRERQKQVNVQAEDDQISLVSSFKEAQEKEKARFKDSGNIAIKVSDLFKE